MPLRPEAEARRDEHLARSTEAPEFMSVWDPGVFTQPWTLAFPPMRDDEYRIYEYTCHEGNRAVEGILRGARDDERTPKR